jgi:hypothetical protein
MFHLNFKPEISSEKINHQQDVLFIGSCFSEHISKKLIDLKFSIDSNPFGIVFNPKSIYLSLQNCIHNTEINESHYMEREENWFCLDAHSSLNFLKKNELQRALLDARNNWREKIKTASWLVITFGSANCYEFKNTQAIISNCHKLPANQFIKKMISSQDIVSDYDSLIKELQLINSNLKIIFTVSPVKHLRDGLIENSLSKSILIQSVHELISKHAHCYYFPAYELVTDDLRDYRFYESDMAHPNMQAINYVFNKFVEVYFTEETKKINKQLSEINLAFQHKSFNSESQSHKAFKLNMMLKCKELVSQFPFLNLKKEINYFEN